MDFSLFSDCVLRQRKRDKWKSVRMSSGKGTHITHTHTYTHVHTHTHTYTPNNKSSRSKSKNNGSGSGKQANLGRWFNAHFIILYSSSFVL
jgi:hypothetical protein